MLCVGDIHIKPDNLHLVELLEKQLIEFIKKTSSKAIILLGDILHYHEKLHTIALNRACELIDNLRKLTKVFVLVGNHDYIQNQQFLTTNHWMCVLKKWSNVCIVDTVINDYIDNIPILLVPYVPPQRFMEALEQFGIDRLKDIKYIFAHQEFKGCKMGALESTEGDIWPIDYPMVVSGHIHNRQKPQPNLFYVGCSIQNSYGDQTTPIILHLPTWEEYPLNMPKKKTIYVDLQDTKDIEKIISEKSQMHPDTQLRVVVTGESMEHFKLWKNTLQSSEDIKIVFKPTISEIDKNNLSIVEGDMDTLISHKILSLRDESLYWAYRNIFWNEDFDHENILII